METSDHFDPASVIFQIGVLFAGLESINAKSNGQSCLSVVFFCLILSSACTGPIRKI